MKYTAFRKILGIYLTWHFIGLFWYSERLFGFQMPFDPTLGPTYDKFPNILNSVEPELVLIAMIVCSVCYTLGIYSRILAIPMWYGWACLQNRNVLIANPGIPYVGWLLLASSMMSNKERDPMGRRVLWVAWFLMALGYTASGLHKLQCPSWIDGTAVIHVLEGPLARNWFIRDLVLSLPIPVLKFLTWGSLAFEISFLPFGVFWHTRFWYWFGSLLFHLGIILTINFTDLTLGVLMIHFFTYEERYWKTIMNYLSQYKLCSYEEHGTVSDPKKDGIVFLYDGDCGVCSWAVNFIIDHDLENHVYFAALKSTYGNDLLIEHRIPINKQTMIPDSMVVIYHGKPRLKSDAALTIMYQFGSLWMIPYYLGLMIPKVVRDAVYDILSENRYRISKYFNKDSCRMMTGDLKKRFLDLESKID